MTSVTAFAPATVSNVACGFDVLGFPLESPGDEVIATLAPSGVRIADILNDGGRLPREAAKNTAGVAVLAFLATIGERRGVTLTIRKGLPLSSGLGGSAASAAAAVVAVNALMGANAPVDFIFYTAESTMHHQFVIATGRKPGATDSHLNQLSFHVEALAEVREVYRRAMANGATSTSMA